MEYESLRNAYLGRILLEMSNDLKLCSLFEQDMIQFHQEWNKQVSVLQSMF